MPGTHLLRCRHGEVARPAVHAHPARSRSACSARAELFSSLAMPRKQRDCRHRLAIRRGHNALQLRTAALRTCRERPLAASSRHPAHAAGRRSASTAKRARGLSSGLTAADYDQHHWPVFRWQARPAPVQGQRTSADRSAGGSSPTGPALLRHAYPHGLRGGHGRDASRIPDVRRASVLRVIRM